MADAQARFLLPAGTLLARGHHGIGWDGIASLGALFMARFRKADLVPFGTFDQAEDLFVPLEVAAVGYPETWNVTLRFMSIPPEGSTDGWAPGTTLQVVGAKFSPPFVEGAGFPPGDLWLEGSDGTGWPEVASRGGSGWPEDDREAMALVEPAAAAAWAAMVPYLAGS